MTATRLRLCTFRGLQNLPLYVAERAGFFAARGLAVEITYTAGSALQLAGLVRGDYDLIQTAPDNVINVDTDPAAFGLDPPSAPRVTMLMGGSTGPLGLYALPSLSTWEGLRGAVLGVDNPSSGFALVMRDMLARHGLLASRDYTMAVAGGTSARLDALRQGTIAATVLYAPYDALAVAHGCRRLATSTDYYPAYASLATAATTAWAMAHAGLVTRYLAAVLRALRWIHDPAYAAAVQELLHGERALALDQDTAARAYAAFVDPATGFGIDAPLSDAGLQQVIDLRAAAAPPRRLGLPDDYRDLRWYRQALQEVQAPDG